MTSNYEGAIIKNIRKLPGRGNIVYAELFGSDGELLIAATLEYIYKELQARMPDKEKS